MGVGFISLERTVELSDNAKREKRKRVPNGGWDEEGFPQRE